MTAARDGRDPKPRPEELERDLIWHAVEVAVSQAAQGHPMRFAQDLLQSLREQGFEVTRIREADHG